MKPIKFTGVQNYLEKLFVGNTPTDQQVIEGKKVYWRAYNTDLKRRIRNEHPTLLLRFSKQEMKLLKEKIHQKELLSIQVRRIVLDYLNGSYNSPNTALIEQQLFLVNEYLEELLEEGKSVPLSKIEELQQSIIAIQDALEQG